MARHVLVTGATGQIGAAVALALAARGDQVRCLVRNPGAAAALRENGCEIAVGDLTDAASLPAALRGVETVAHLAGKTSYWPPDGELMQRINVDGTAALLDAAAAAGVRSFLFTSSIATLGWVAGDGIGNEDTPYNWHGVGIGYFDTKLAAERLVLGEQRMHKVVVNPGIVFGRGDVNHNGLRLLLRMADGKVPGYAPGATTAAVLRDVVAGHLAALEHGRDGERYVLGGATLSFRELFALIAHAVDRPAPTWAMPRPVLRAVAAAHTLRGWIKGREPFFSWPLFHAMTRNRRYSSAKAVAELGYAITPLEDALRDCWAWYQQRAQAAAHTDASGAGVRR